MAKSEFFLQMRGFEFSGPNEEERIPKERGRRVRAGEAGDFGELENLDAGPANQKNGRPYNFPSTRHLCYFDVTTRHAVFRRRECFYEHPLP